VPFRYWVAASRNPQQKKDYFLNCRGQAEQVYVLRHMGAGDIAKPLNSIATWVQNLPWGNYARNSYGIQPY